MKIYLKGKKFENVEDIKRNKTELLHRVFRGALPKEKLTGMCWMPGRLFCLTKCSFSLNTLDIYVALAKFMQEADDIAEIIHDADHADDLVLVANTPYQA